jgi:hypothetical protein
MHIYVYFFSRRPTNSSASFFQEALNGTGQLNHGMLSYGKLKLFHCPFIPVKSLQGVVVKFSVPK